MNNQWTLKRKRDVLKAYFMIFVMFLFLFSPAFSLNSYDIVFADDGIPTSENDDGSSGGDGDGDNPADPAANDSDDSGDDSATNDDVDGGDDPVTNDNDDPEPAKSDDEKVVVPLADDGDESAEPKKAELGSPSITQAMCDGDTPTDPEIDLPSMEGVDYAIEGEVKAGETVRIVATAQEGYELELTGDWDFDGDQAVLVVELNEVQCSEVKDMDGVVTQGWPTLYQPYCESDGTIVMPTIDINHLGVPLETGVLYDFYDADTGEALDFDNLQPGQTIGITAAPYDRYEGEGLKLNSSLPGWTEIEEGMMIAELPIDDPYCVGEVGEGDDEGGSADPKEPADLGSGEIIKIDRDGCIVSITTSLSEGKYVLEVWDDGMKIDEVTKTVTEVGEHVFTWEITEPAMETAPGVGFFLKDENGSDLDMVDPFEYPAEVADKCGGVTKDDSDMGEADILGQGGPAVVSTDDTGHVLPSTATPLFNLLVIGFVLLTLGGLNLLLFRARKT